ncbi:TetR/AcrR family transcriptional regulator [Amycolatopsis sp. NPDC049691]|uniref:TetR/AcrR family transcriptional regulator n=1 Tax=Amycolatopsis sp. NPDC049691 TaxID=3155155 RepID=UPI003438917E
MLRIGDERRAAQRQRILDAAMTCFEQAGAIYRYFDGKEAVAADRHEHERDLVAAAITDGGPDALKRFLDTCFGWVADPEEARRRRVTVHGIVAGHVRADPARAQPGLPAPALVGAGPRPAPLPRHGDQPPRSGVAFPSGLRVSLTPCSAR